jgi:hypothetical protein
MLILFSATKLLKIFMVFPIRSVYLDRCSLDVTNLNLLGDFHKKTKKFRINIVTCFFSCVSRNVCHFFVRSRFYLFYNCGRKFEFNIVIVRNNLSWIYRKVVVPSLILRYSNCTNMKAFIVQFVHIRPTFALKSDFIEYNTYFCYGF